jgi:hypothetical protein
LVQTYQNGKNIPNDHKLCQKAVNYTKCPWNITAFSIPRPYKFYQNWDFWFENKPSGNPGWKRKKSTVAGRSLPVRKSLGQQFRCKGKRFCCQPTWQLWYFTIKNLLWMAQSVS